MICVCGTKLCKLKIVLDILDHPVYSPGAGADNPLGPKYFHKHKFSVHLLIPSKFSAIK